MTGAALVSTSGSATRSSRFVDNPKLDQWICFWSIPVFYTLFGVIFGLLGRIMPPPTPTMSTEGIVAFMTSPGLSLAVVLLALSLGL